MIAEAPLPFSIECRPPLLVTRFATPQRMLSWSITRPGFVTAEAVAWLEVRDADLPIGTDPVALLDQTLAHAGLGAAVGLMTACDLRSHRLAQDEVDGVVATVVTTVGLTNGEFVGRRRDHPRGRDTHAFGTINTLVHVSVPLSQVALLEASSVATQARTVAVLEATMRRGSDVITGTGTDCIVVAAPVGADPAPYAGLHTAIGEAIGSAVLTATRGAVARWFAAQTRPPRALDGAAPKRRAAVTAEPACVGGPVAALGSRRERVP
ncbi:hypothetical protein EYW49_13015 [Siculibacillus lacustris]|uniref:Adenosylcobinamide amidohydrolase n=1 Tax=Siculibacillus lacustris TaxID=1549641 RepID=A0A4Q9VNM4_9HYPH|nr:adenosylcobinamide amidohydrolase [Siculibacillus lacustris]TBW36758.1 hypothetical protein EYW49_13015 [Siculibacillus lacustris]